MSDASSDNSAEFKSFLANVRLLSVSPEVQEAESVLIDPSSVPQSVRLQSASPETQDWDSFLAAFSTSSAAVPTWPLVSEPPLCSSEDLEESRAVTTQPSDSESSSEGVEESTSADDYRPSPVIKPVLYKRPGSCSADEGVGDFLHTLDQISADPFFWGPGIEGLHSLTPGVYVIGQCIDFNLRTHWMKEGKKGSMWFVHLEGVRRLQSKEGLDPEELQHLQQQLSLPTEEGIEIYPVVLVVHFVNHYFVVVADYEGDVMYVFGRHTNQELAGVYLQEEEDWVTWHGNFIWKNLPNLFQWEECSQKPSAIFSVSWPQNGLDCGAIVCSVAKALLKNGIEFDQEGLVMAPTIECAHYSRLRLLNENIDDLKCCYHLYQMMPPDMFAIPEDSAVYAMSVGLEAHIHAEVIRKRLATVRDKCTRCKQQLQMRRAEIDEHDQDFEEDYEEEDEDEWEKKNKKSDSDSERESMAGPRNDNSLTVVPRVRCKRRELQQKGLFGWYPCCEKEQQRFVMKDP